MLRKIPIPPGDCRGRDTGRSGAHRERPAAAHPSRTTPAKGKTSATLTIESAPISPYTDNFKPVRADQPLGRRRTPARCCTSPCCSGTSPRRTRTTPWLADSFTWNTDGTAITFKVALRGQVVGRPADDGQGRRLHLQPDEGQQGAQRQRPADHLGHRRRRHHGDDHLQLGPSTRTCTRSPGRP